MGEELKFQVTLEAPWKNPCYHMCIWYSNVKWNKCAWWYFSKQEIDLLDWEWNFIIPRISTLVKIWDLPWRVQKDLEPIINDWTVCLNVFNGGIVTYACFVNVIIERYHSWMLPFVIKFHMIFMNKFIVFQLEKKKCKVLEIVLDDLEGNLCEIIAFVYLWMLSKLPTSNTRTKATPRTLMITSKAQVDDDIVLKEKRSSKTTPYEPTREEVAF